MRLILFVWFLFLPSLALPDALDRAAQLFDTGDPQGAISAAKEVLSGDPDPQSRLEARELIALSQFDMGRSGTAFVADLRALDRDLAGFFGAQSDWRLSVLSVLSAALFELGQIDASLDTDIQIIRIARDIPEAGEDLLIALRNIAVTLETRSDPMVAARFAALYEFFATDLRAYDDPLRMEATALLSLSLFRAEAPVRALQRFASYSFEDWQAFADIGPDEAALAEEMIDAVQVALEDGERDWEGEVQARFARTEALEVQIDTINTHIQAQDMQAALPLMDDYLGAADPEDAWAGVFSGMIMRRHLALGRFDKARPYLAGMLSYPPRYAAALDIPAGVLAATVALEGGADEALIAALLDLGIAVEAILMRPDPEIRIDLFHLKGLAMARTGQPDAALKAYRAALEEMEGTGYQDSNIKHQSLSGAGEALVALGRDEEARPVLIALRDSAGAEGDHDALSAALGGLSRLELRLDRPQIAMRYAEQKLALELARQAPDPGAVLVARLNLAVLLLTQSDGITPQLADVVARVMEGDAPTAELDATRTAFLTTLSARLGQDAQALERDPIFASLGRARQAGVLAAMVDHALDQSDLERAASMLRLALSRVTAQSPEYMRLKQAEGRIALAQGNTVKALAALRTATEYYVQPGRQDLPGALDHLPDHLSALLGHGNDKDRLREAFEVAQMALSTKAGAALNDAIARGQTDAAVGDLLRQRQALDRELLRLDRAIARAAYDGKTPDDLMARAVTARQTHAALSARIDALAPELRNISAPVPLADLQARLRPDEVMLLYVTSTGSGSFVLAVNDQTMRAARLPGRSDLGDIARGLRCSAALTDPGCAGRGAATTRGSFSLSLEPASPGIPPFDADLAHRAYQTLITPVQDVVSGRDRMIIVADQALIALPFHLMLKAPMAPGQSLRDGGWMIRDHSIELAPTVSSFVTMRAATDPRVTGVRFLGVGDPLIGVQRNGPVPFECTDTPAAVQLASLGTQALSRGFGQARTRAVVELSALPDTRCELRQIARQFGPESRLMLQDEASEAGFKALSASGQLRDYTVIHFATHGLVAGEIGINQSGLVLSPPALPTAEDDGLLTTDEIAALDLNADFVILSACNTASGDSDTNEALSGMASAFFFAGARSLMVSHWPVYSDAAVDLSTRSFEALRADAGVARAEAVRRAMLGILADPASGPRELHPAYWGPFMIVGDGLGLAVER